MVIRAQILPTIALSDTFMCRLVLVSCIYIYCTGSTEKYFYDGGEFITDIH